MVSSNRHTHTQTHTHTDTHTHTSEKYEKENKRELPVNCFYGWFPCFQNIFPGCLTLLNCTAISSNDDDYTFEFSELTSFKILEFNECCEC